MTNLFHSVDINNLCNLFNKKNALITTLSALRLKPHNNL